MKRNEILGEHKKGTKAVKYNKKPNDPTAEFGKAKEKLAPQKPLEEGSSDYVSNAIEDLRVSMPGLDRETFLDELYSYLDARHGKRAADAAMDHGDNSVYDEFYDNYSDLEEGYRDRRDAYQRDYDSSVSGMGKRQSRAYQDDGGANDERHDLDPSDWYVVKDGKMFKVSIYPNQEQEATARGYSRTREQARARADADTRSTDEDMGAEVGKITKVDPATKKATLTKADGSSMEVDSTALKPTPDGKMQMDTPDADQLKMGTAVVSTEELADEATDSPPNDSTSPIHGGRDAERAIAIASNDIINMLKRMLARR
jgi:hypothetical protein